MEKKIKNIKYELYKKDEQYKGNYHVSLKMFMHMTMHYTFYIIINTYRNAII